MSAAHVGPHDGPHESPTLLPQLVPGHGSGTALRPPPGAPVSGAADDEDDEMRTRYLTFSAEVAPMLQELLMEYTLSEVVEPHDDNMELREDIQREVDRQTTYLMHCVSDFAAGVTTTVDVHTRAVSAMSLELHNILAREIPDGTDITPLCDYLQHRHDAQMHAPDTLHTAMAVPVEFTQIVHQFEQNLHNITIYTSEEDTTSGHGHMSHVRPRVALGWMSHVQQIQRGDWILQQMHELCRHAQRIQIRVQERLATNIQLSASCIQSQVAYATAIGTTAGLTGRCDSHVVQTISAVVYFSVLCIFMQCGMNLSIGSRGDMSQADRDTLVLAFRAGMNGFYQIIQQHIRDPLEQYEHTCTLPFAQPDNFHGKAAEIWQSGDACKTLCENECLDAQNITWRDIMQTILNFAQPPARETDSPTPLSFGSGNRTKPGGVASADGGDGNNGGGGSSGGRCNSSCTYCSFATEMVQCMIQNHVLEHIRGKQWAPIDVNM